ncbi:uncharacterized protein LOC18431102 isoform X2 [Amborella trichopoda]|uniref:uncharacterized protein LOC18431102 isoform X2 n=1 Tax=Amborella trichopoda TaxID=13333 RepID=UPI0005D2F898|nr:uncharacterized protein LOC18431102 isoform X2 [Amborella trichopoda]|eukprot:XP_011622188.1 uncharacterized protein LOC18431102 isoform X2 [Amborella trichopoda]
MEIEGGAGGGGQPQKLQCVGRLQVAKHKQIGFVCGTLPVPTDDTFISSLVRSSHSQKVRAPRYRVLPTETDLNYPPLIPNIPEKVFPLTSVGNRAGDLQWESCPINQPLARKCETLAVTGLAEYGDEIDVVAPVDILKQIFKIPYSKARISIAVHRIGQTLILNTGPDVEEGENLVRRRKNQAKGGDQSLFLNFAMHSVRAEACDCPPARDTSSDDQENPTILPQQFEERDDFFTSSINQAQYDAFHSQNVDCNVADTHANGFNFNEDYSQGNHANFSLRGRHQKRGSKHGALKETSQFGERSRSPIQESEKHRRVGNDGFLRVLFWQFHNFRMLLGSDLFLFSNEKYVAVSLHLWDIGRQITPLMWLEAWLDNVMASVPELAICYHRNGVVQGYELLKTDDIFLLKGIAEDGTTSFHPQVVQQNGLSVLRFLQDNCKQDPGSYWNHSPDDQDKSCNSLPSMMHKGRRDALFQLGTLLYRLAHKLSLSRVPNNRSKCAKLFQQCLEFLDEQEHLVVRAFAHEQFARLILKCYDELNWISDSVLEDFEATVCDVEDKSANLPLGETDSYVQEKKPSQSVKSLPFMKNAEDVRDSVSEAYGKMNLETHEDAGNKDSESSKGKISSNIKETIACSMSKDTMAVCQVCEIPHIIQTVSDPISSKLAAIHHVSQAIKSLRWQRQLRDSEGKLVVPKNKIQDRAKSPAEKFSLCACGDVDCIEVCDIREWLAKSKMDHKLWKLVLLLGESYLALGEAYKDDGQLHQALKVVELACSVYGSMPACLDDEQFITSMVSNPSSVANAADRNRKWNSVQDGVSKLDSSSSGEGLRVDKFPFNHLFWAKAWTLVGDVYVECNRIRGKGDSKYSSIKQSEYDLRVSTEVAKEVKRLKKKLGQFQQNCNMCSLINCSCQSDRASSGNSASSSNGDGNSMAYGRNQSRKPNAKNSLHLRNLSSDKDCEENKLKVSCGPEFGTMGMSKTSAQKSSHSLPSSDDMKAADHPTDSESSTGSGSKAPEVIKEKHRGIFSFLVVPEERDIEYFLSRSICCYNAAMKALSEVSTSCSDKESIVKKKGWVCNELGRYRLDNRDLRSAELAFADAIQAFMEVSDFSNVVLINCNLGHGRRALAELMVSTLENYRKHEALRKAYDQAFETAKLEYRESLKYYDAAKSVLALVNEEAGSLSSSLRNEVYTQSAHTYLRLGMLLARDNVTAEIYANDSLGEIYEGYNSLKNDKVYKKEARKREISANDAIREALHLYESLGELRGQESAYAHFQLACYHRDCCFKMLDSGCSESGSSKSENTHMQKVKRYASLAERNWQKSIDFYGPKTHPMMYLNILMERSAFCLRLSSVFYSNTMLDSALSQLLEGRFAAEGDKPLELSHDETDAMFCNQLQRLLKSMLAMALAAKNTSKSDDAMSNRVGDVKKLRELYRMSLKMSGLADLNAMHELWTSE